jgi:hypothetical protein
MRDQEFIDLENAYAKIYEQVQNEPVEEVDNYDEILEYLLSEGYSKEESDQIMVELINEAGLGSLLKGAKAVAGFIAKRAKTPLRTAATDSLITSTALNPVSTAKVAKTIAKSAPSPAPIVRTVKAPSVRTAPKGANKITTNVWNEPTAPSSRINPSKPSGTKVTSTKALSGTPSRPALPSVGKTSATVKAPKPTFKPEALPKATKSAEPGGALVRTKAPKPTFKPEALPKVKSSAEPGGALVSTRAPKPSFKPEALPKATKSAEPGGALVSTRAPKPTFKPEALPKAIKSAEPGGALVRTKAPKPSFNPEALPKETKFAEPAGALVRTKASKPTSRTTTSGGGKPSKGGGLTQTIRATLSPAEKTGNMKYPGLEKYATGSSSSGGPSRAPISALSRNLKTAGIVGTALAGTAALDQGLKSEKRRRDTEMRKNIKTDVYNTMDAPSMDKPTGQIRSRLKVGSRKIGSTFDDAFREAKRKEKEAKRIGDPVPTTFTYAGKEYSTKMKENYVYEAKDETEEGITGLPIPKKKMSAKKRHEFEKKRRAARKERGDDRVGDTFSQHRMTGSRGRGSEHEVNPRVSYRHNEEYLIDYLLGEGFASDEKSAEAIMGAMSEEWKHNIIEAPGEWFGGLRDKARASRAAQMQSSKPTPKPGPTVSSPFAKPASTNDSGRLTTYGAGGGAAAERRGQTRAQVMQQGAKNLENKNRNPGPNFGR